MGLACQYCGPPFNKHCDSQEKPLNKEMIKRQRLFFTVLLLSIFSAQSVLACACDLDNQPSHDHQHMDHGDMGNVSDQNCDGNCHLSFMQNDSNEFTATLALKIKTEQKLTNVSVYPISHAIHIREFQNYNFVPIENHNLQSFSLLYQGTLLRI